MFADLQKLNERFPKFKIESGHRTCHPETCQCWDIRVYNLKGKNVHNTNSYESVVKFCESN